jgi:hypothetical protein
MAAWDDMRRTGRLLRGRFVSGRVYYVARERAPVYVAAYRTHWPEHLTPLEKSILSALKKGPMGVSDISSALGVPVDGLKPALRVLDENMYVVREFSDRELWGRRNLYALLELSDLPDRETAIADLVGTYLRSSGPATLSEIRHQTGFTGLEVRRALEKLGAESVITGSGDTDFYVLPDDLPLLETPVPVEGNVMLPLTFISLYDPLAATFRRELYARYGQGWMHPAVKDGVLVGMMEDWPLNGGIDIRETDLPGIGPAEFAQALKKLMGYYSFFGLGVALLQGVPEGMDLKELKKHLAL